MIHSELAYAIRALLCSKIWLRLFQQRPEFLEFKQKQPPNPKLLHMNKDVDFFIPLYITIL